MSCIYSLGFYWYLYFTVLHFFFSILLLICIFVDLLHVLRNFVNSFYILSSRSGVNVDKDITCTVCLQSNITSLELWRIFPIFVLFLLVWCKQKSDKKVKIILLFLMCMTLLSLKNKNSSDSFNKVRTCTRFFCVRVHGYLWWFSIFGYSNEQHFLFCF